MRIVHFEKEGVPGIAANDGAGWHGLTKGEGGFPGTLPELIAQGADLLRGGKALLPMHAIDLNAVRILPPVLKPPKILCVGLNYDDHLEESGLKSRSIRRFSRDTRRVLLLTVSRSGGHASRPRSTMRRSSPW